MFGIIVVLIALLVVVIGIHKDCGKQAEDPTTKINTQIENTAGMVEETSETKNAEVETEKREENEEEPTLSTESEYNHVENPADTPLVTQPLETQPPVTPPPATQPPVIQPPVNAGENQTDKG